MGETARLEMHLDYEVASNDEAVNQLTRSPRRLIREADLAGVKIDRLSRDLPAGARDGVFELGALALVSAPALVEQTIQPARDRFARLGTKSVKAAVRISGREVSAEHDASWMTVREPRAIAGELRVMPIG
jgi:hypothetical protein